MASIRKRTTSAGARYDVRFRAADGSQRTRTFARAVDARRFLAVTEADLARGDWIDPDQARRETVVEWVERLHAAKDIREKSRARERSTIDHQIVPRWDGVPLAAVTHGDVIDWASSMRDAGLSASSRRKALGLLSATFRLAARAGVWRGGNPCDGVTTAQPAKRSIVALTRVEVAAIAGRVAAGGRDDLAALVHAAAETGLRQGELLALRSANVDLGRRRVLVRESVSEINGRLVIGPVKSAASKRDVPLSRRGAEILAGRPPGLLWPSANGEPMSAVNMYRRHFRPAAVAVADELGLDRAPRFHDLRHTYAAWCLAAGVPPKTLQRWMGHSTIMVTLDTYGALMPDEDDHALDRLDAWGG